MLRTGISVVADYLPLQEGATWTYRVTLGDATYLERWRCREIGTGDAGTARTFIVGWEQQFPGSENAGFHAHFDDVDHYIVSADGSYVAKRTCPTDLSAYPVPGWKAELENDEISWILRSDTGPDGKIENREQINEAGDERIGSYIILDMDERVIVPAGAFDHCLHVQSEVRLAERNPGSNGPFPEDRVVEAWYAPRVGLVKRRRLGPGSGEEEIRFLVAFSVE